MTIEVIGMGAVAMDIVLRCSQLPQEDGYAVISTESAVPGGSCANVLTALAGLGTKSGLIACLGDDAHGQALMADLQTHGVATRYVCVKKDGDSMHTYVAVSKSGAKTILCHMGNSLLSLAEKDMHGKMLRGVKAFYTGMQPAKPALKLMRLCREEQIPVICNLQVEPDFLDLCGVCRPLVEEMLSLCGLLITFRHGLIRHTGQKDINAAARSLYERYRPAMGLIVTLGKEGALWLDRESSLLVPAYPVDATDTTGAGDAFIAGIIHAGFSESFDRKVAMKFANACAAMKCTQPGPRLKASRSDIVKFMRQNGTG